MKYDVAVIGGGPAGMMAAGRAGERGARVLLLEKNINLGVKLLATGHGRCNLTNVSADVKPMVCAYGKNGKFLFSSFHRFGAEDLINFFANRGVVIKREDNGRVFPKSDNARDILNAFRNYLSESKVEIRFGAKVKEIISSGDKIQKIILANGDEIFADNFIVSTGGLSYPGTGSTGDGYKWLKKLGHTIISPRPALTPVVVKEKFVKELEGLSLKDIEISVFKAGKKVDVKIGEAIFTADGMSGPVIINLSNGIGRILPGKINLRIDFRPELDLAGLDRQIQKDFQTDNNKLFRNYLVGTLSPKLAPVIIKLSGIDGEKKVNLITKKERKRLTRVFKEFTLEVKGLKGFNKAMITAGGVELKEVDPKTMRSKLFQNLFLAGEILDLDGPTGGYNLQICWSTGYAAGDSAGFANLGKIMKN